MRRRLRRKPVGLCRLLLLRRRPEAIVLRRHLRHSHLRRRLLVRWQAIVVRHLLSRWRRPLLLLRRRLEAIVRWWLLRLRRRLLEAIRWPLLLHLLWWRPDPMGVQREAMVVEQQLRLRREKG